MNTPLLVAALGAAILVGCGSGQNGPSLSKVTGEVLFDNTPVDEGFIIFRDASGEQKSYGAPIRGGQFRAEVEPGQKIVEVTATREIPGKTTFGASGEQIAATESYLPERYNTKSELTTDIVPLEGNTLNLELTSLPGK